MENTEINEGEFDKENIEVDDIGTILKSNRLKAKKSLEAISNELCIRKIYLTAIEEGDMETLPPIPYGVGYVRTYAKYLGLNPERAVKLYKSSSIVEPEKSEILEQQEEINQSNSKHIWIGVLALFCVYAAWSLSANYKDEHKNIIEEENAQVTEIITNDEEVLEDKIDDTPKNEEIETTASEEKVEINENTETTVVEEHKDTVFLEFLGETWAELKDKNTIYTQGVFHKGDTKEIKYVKDLYISVGRPQNVKIIVLGEEKDILAKKRKSNISIDSLKQKN